MDADASQGRDKSIVVPTLLFLNSVEYRVAIWSGRAIDADS